MSKLRIPVTLFFALLITYTGYILYQYFPNKHRSITSFCVSNATLQQWSEYFQKNDDKFIVRLLPDKSKPEQDLLFNSKQVRQIKQIKSANPTVELVYERNSNNKSLFYGYYDKIYAGTTNKCTQDADYIDNLTD